MPGGVIAQAFVEITADSAKFESDLTAQVKKPLASVEQTADKAATGVNDAFRRTAEDIQREFGLSGRAAEQALEMLNSQDFVELRAAAARTGESVDRAMSQAAEEADHHLEAIDNQTFSELRGDAARTGESIERDFKEAATSADRSLDGIEKSGAGHMRGLGLAVAGAGAILGTLGGLAVKQGLATAGGLEQSETAFTGVLGSAEAAQAEMAKLTDFAARTPLELPGLLEMDSRLIAVKDSLGLTQDQILPFVGTVGDLASTLGQGQPQMDAVVIALSQMGSAGRVSAADVGQISNALPGFNAWKAIADGMGLTVAQVRDLGEKGQLTADQAIPALIQGMKDFPGAAGAMERSSQTLNGQLSTFKDTANIALAQGLGPLVEGIKTQLPGITAGLPALFGSIGVAATTIFDRIGPAISGALAPLGAVIGQIGPILDPFLATIAAIGEAVSPAIVAVFTALGAAMGKLTEPLANLGGAVGDAVAKVFTALAPILPPIAAALGNILDAVLPLVAPLGDFLALLAGALGPVISEAAGLIGDMAAQFTLGLGPALNDILDALRPLMPIFVELIRNALLPLGPQLPEIARSMGELAGSVAELVVAILPLLEPFLKLQILIQKLTGAALQQVAKLLIVVADAVARLLSWVAKAIPPLDTFQDWFRTFGAAVVGAWDSAWASVTDVVETATDAVIGAGMAVVQFFQTVWAGIEQFIIQPVQAAFDFIRPIFDGFITFVEVDLRVVATLIAAPFIAAFLVLQPVVTVGWAAVQAVFEAAVAWYTAVWNTVNTLLVQPIQAGLTAAFTVASTVWATVQAVFQAGVDWVTSTWSTISGLLSGPVQSGIDAVSTAVSTSWAVAQGTLQTAIDWVTNTWKTVEGLLETPVDNAVEGIKTVIGGLWDAVKLALNPVIDGLNAVINAWNGLEFTLPEIQLPSFGGLDVGGVTVIPGWEGPTLPSISVGTPNIGNIPRLDTGGLITAAGLAFLHPAEVVVPAPDAGRMGGVNFNGPVSFGTDSSKAIADLDWWVRFKVGGVP